jgi:hypothetical protein
MQCFYALNTHVTASNIMSFASTGGGAMKVTATEWTGGAIVSPVDVMQNSGSNQSSGTGGGQNISSGAATTTGADLVIGMAGVTAGTLTVGTGFTSSSAAGLEYQTQTGPTALAATWSDNTNNDSYAALMVAFRPFAGTATSATDAVITDTSGIQGITVAGAGNSGNAIIQQSGIAFCSFDGPTSASDYVQNSATVPGACHDTGSASAPLSGQIIGHVLSTNATGGAYSVELLGPEFSSGVGTGTERTICANTTKVSVNANSTAQQPLQTCQFPNGSLNAVGKSFRLTFQADLLPGGTSASGLYLGAGTTSALGSYVGSFASQTSSANSWTASIQLTCTVLTTGTTATLRCLPLPIVYSASGSPITPLTLGGSGAILSFVNLTGPVFVGPSCLFGTGSSSNVCDSYQLLVEQLN